MVEGISVRKGVLALALPNREALSLQKQGDASGFEENPFRDGSAAAILHRANPLGAGWESLCEMAAPVTSPVAFIQKYIQNDESEPINGGGGE